MELEFFEKFRVDELKIFETNYWIVSLRPQQITLGSLILSIKRKCNSMGEILQIEAEELSNVFYKIERLLQNAFDYDKINYLSLMMIDNHLHFHVIPRYSKNRVCNNIIYYDINWPYPPNIMDNIMEENQIVTLLNKLKEIYETNNSRNSEN